MIVKASLLLTPPQLRVRGGIFYYRVEMEASMWSQLTSGSGYRKSLFLLSSGGVGMPCYNLPRAEIQAPHSAFAGRTDGGARVFFHGI